MYLRARTTLPSFPKRPADVGRVRYRLPLLLFTSLDPTPPPSSFGDEATRARPITLFVVRRRPHRLPAFTHIDHLLLPSIPCLLLHEQKGRIPPLPRNGRPTELLCQPLEHVRGGGGQGERASPRAGGRRHGASKTRGGGALLPLREWSSLADRVLRLGVEGRPPQAESWRCCIVA